jgi:hypothetical protein
MQFAFVNRAAQSSTKFQPLPDIWTTVALAGLTLHIPQPDLHLEEQQPIPNERGNKGRFKRTVFTTLQSQTLWKWLRVHQSNPYPTVFEKELLMRETGLKRDQINVWFTNHRIREGFTLAHRFSVPPALPVLV